MKKMLALFLALIMMLSFTACGSNTEATTEATTEPQPLPVKFGSVTGIETTADKTEAIVLSMDEPSSSKGAERDVYIAAVDYIFTHAHKDLEELSVTANAPNGDSIISFTMPSNLISSLRETEAEGSWGTEGFCAYFYFNYDAYDELVAGCVYSNATIKPTIETAEVTASNPSIKSENITIAFSYGERSGMYVGFVDENGLPDGTGTFESVNSEGVKWTYSGDWKHGHMDGHGISKWETGKTHCGEYVNDEASGYGVLFDGTGNVFAGNFENGHLNGYGAVYVGDGIVFWGNYNNGNAETGKVYLSDGSVVDASHINDNISYTYKLP